MKFLTGVTITGADDKVSVLKLQDLSREFPFVEWGVLVSPKKCLVPRYPGTMWMTQFRRANVAKSVHFCGTCASDNQSHWLVSLLGADRAQLNGLTDYAAAVKIATFDMGGTDHILQVRTQEVFCDAVMAAFRIHEVGGRASILWDPSGGRGIYTKPVPINHGQVPIGYAGGISPDNIHEVLESLAPGGPCWIDMESGVRTNDELDLVKVRSVLEQARPYVLEEYCG